MSRQTVKTWMTGDRQTYPTRPWTPENGEVKGDDQAWTGYKVSW